MELDRIFFLRIEGKDTLRLVSFISDFAVGRVVTEKDVIFLREGNCFFVEAVISDGARGIIGVIEKKKLCLFADFFRYLFEFWKKRSSLP